MSAVCTRIIVAFGKASATSCWPAGVDRLLSADRLAGWCWCMHQWQYVQQHSDVSGPVQAAKGVVHAWLPLATATGRPPCRLPTAVGSQGSELTLAMLLPRLVVSSTSGNASCPAERRVSVAVRKTEPS